MASQEQLAEVVRLLRALPADKIEAVRHYAAFLKERYGLKQSPDESAPPLDGEPLGEAGATYAPRMSRRDRGILDEFAAAIRKDFPEARLWALGSRTTGRATEESDLDVCVVVSRHDEAVREKISHIAWEVGFEHNLVISTVVYSREEFEEGPCSVSALVRTVLASGVPA